MLSGACLDSGRPHAGWAPRARRILGRVRKAGNLAREGFGSRDVWWPGLSGLADQKRLAEGLGHLEEALNKQRAKPMVFAYGASSS